MKFISIVLLNLLFCCALCDEADNDERKLSVKLNPDCVNQTNSCDFTFVHIEAESINDTIHYIWDFTGFPSLLLARTDKNVTLKVDWDSFMKGSVNSLNFSSPPSYISSAVIHKIIVFDDPDDSANVNDESVQLVRNFDPRYFTWSRENLTQLEDQTVMMVMRSRVGENGTFAFKLSAFGSTKHGDELPHLYHSSHSMQLDLIADKINLSNYTSPRVAIEFLIVSSENKNEGTFKLHKRRNLDDEFTPGIFDVFDITSPRSTNNTSGAFFQYRPVCYTTKARTVSGSTELHQGVIRSFNNKMEEIEEFQYTLPFTYFGYGLGSKIAEATNITFGMHGDGFYSRSNYISFSMLMGLGPPPVEKLSAFVVTFAVIGLGIPLLVLLIGGSYVAIKRYRN